MGASGKWVKSIIGLKKAEKDETVRALPNFFTFHKKPYIFLLKAREILLIQEKGSSGKNKKWKLWRSSSGDLGFSGFKGRHRSESEVSDSSNAYSAAVATVVRAHPKDFRAVREEWASIRIQTAFRGFLVSNLFALNRNYIWFCLLVVREDKSEDLFHNEIDLGFDLM